MIYNFWNILQRNLKTKLLLWLGSHQELVLQQQSQENEHPKTGDEILATIFGKKSSFIQGRGYGKKPPRTKVVHRVDADASMSLAMENVREQEQTKIERKVQEEHADMERKLQEEHAEMESKL